MKILVINAGSSSLKYQLIDMETEHLLAKGLCERIGIDGHLKHTPLIGGKPVFDEDLAMPTHSEAIAAVIVLVGAFNVYFKMQNGDQDVKKTIMLTIGGCIAFIALSEALPLFFK